MEAVQNNLVVTGGNLDSQFPDAFSSPPPQLKIEANKIKNLIESSTLIVNSKEPEVNDNTFSIARSMFWWWIILWELCEGEHNKILPLLDSKPQRPLLSL